MRIDRLTPVLASLFCLLGVAPLLAQPNPAAYPTPRLTIVSPTGGKPGTTVELTLTGADIDGATDLVFSHPGFKSELLGQPMDSGSTSPRPRGQQGMAAATTTIRFKVAIPPDAPQGTHDVRVVGKWGVTNPRAFVLSSLEDVLEKEPNNDVSEAQSIALESAVTGVIANPTDVDYYAFNGKKGQRVVAACDAWGVDSRLTAQVQIFDILGRELASNRNYRDRDAVADAILPADGEYRVRVSEFAHLAGGPEYFYRLTLTTGPWIDAAYPPVVEAGKESVVTLFGRNLPGGSPDPKALLDGKPLDRLEVRITAPTMGSQNVRDVLPGSAASVSVFEYRLRSGNGSSNAVLLGLARAPIVLDNEDNETPEKAQTIPLPCEVCGRLEKRGDRDRYVFTAKQGDVLMLDAQCDRLGYPADLYVQVLRADTRAIVAELDDPDPATDIPAAVGAFYVRTEDPRGRVRIPADGRYEVVVASRTVDVRADPRSVYRLTLEPETPDFSVAVVGSGAVGAGGCTLRQGGSQELQVVCLRNSAFTGDVFLEAVGLPEGVTCPPQAVGPNLKQTSLVLTAAPNARINAGSFRVQATATVNGEKIVREAAAGCVVWPIAVQQNQQPTPSISRLCRSLVVAVTEAGPFSLTTPDREVNVPVGGSVSVKVEVKRQDDFKGAVQIVRLSGPMQSTTQPIQIQPLTIAAGNNSGEIKFTVPANAPPGSYNLVLQGTSQVSFSKDPASKQKVNVNVIEAVPSVTVTVYSGVVDLAPAARMVAVKPGEQASLMVKLTRLGNYKGPVKLELVSPPGFTGVSADPVNVGPNETEAKLVLKAAANAKEATNSNVIVRATADRATKPQEVRVTVAVSKDAEAAFAGETSAKTLIAASSAGWKYIGADKLKGDDWKKLDFNERGWKDGKAPIGYGEEEIANRKGTTLTEQGDVLFRRVIDIPAEMLSQKGTSFRLLVASDDSAEVYVNGDLVDDDPEADHEFMYWNREVDVGAKVFKPGRNVIAVRVRNKAGSSDLYLDLELSALVPVAPKK